MGGFVAIYTDAAGTRHQLFEVWSSDSIEIYFQHLGAKGPFVDLALRDVLRERLNAAAGLKFTTAVLSRRPTVPFGPLHTDALDRMLAVFEWVIETIDAAVAEDSVETAVRGEDGQHQPKLSVRQLGHRHQPLAR